MPFTLRKLTVCVTWSAKTRSASRSFTAQLFKEFPILFRDFLPCIISNRGQTLFTDACMQARIAENLIQLDGDILRITPDMKAIHTIAQIVLDATDGRCQYGQA